MNIPRNPRTGKTRKTQETELMVRLRWDRLIIPTNIRIPPKFLIASSTILRELLLLLLAMSAR